MKGLVTYKKAAKRLANFSTKTLQARRDWHKIFQVTKNKDLQPRLLYSARLSLKLEDKKKSLPDSKTMAKRVHLHQIELQEILKGLLQ